MSVITPIALWGKEKMWCKLQKECKLKPGVGGQVACLFVLLCYFTEVNKGTLWCCPLIAQVSSTFSTNTYQSLEYPIIYINIQ